MPAFPSSFSSTYDETYLIHFSGTSYVRGWRKPCSDDLNGLLILASFYTPDLPLRSSWWQGLELTLHNQQAYWNLGNDLSFIGTSWRTIIIPVFSHTYNKASERRAKCRALTNFGSGSWYRRCAEVGYHLMPYAYHLFRANSPDLPS